MKATIYEIVSPSNKRYIGSTKRNVELRIKEHQKCLNNNKHHNFKLQNAFNKYKNLKINILEEFEYTNEKDIFDKEQYYIDLIKPEYNISDVAYSIAGGQKSIIAKNIFSKEEFKFNSVVEAGIKLNIINNTNISSALNKKRKQAGGYVFKFKDDLITNLDDLINIRNTSKANISSPIIGKNIITGETVEFVSISQAQKILKINNIFDVILNKRKQSGNYIFKLKNDNLTNLNQLIEKYLDYKSKLIKKGGKVFKIIKIEGLK